MLETDDTDGGHLDLEGEIAIDLTRPVNTEGAFGELFCGVHPQVSVSRRRPDADALTITNPGG